MRVLLGFFIALIFCAAASAADLKVKVLDPQSAAVDGAQVSLVREQDGKVLATQTTSAEGIAMFRVPGQEPYQVQVLAPGFAPETAKVSSQAELTVNLRLATASETVVVTGTRTPVPSASVKWTDPACSAWEAVTPPRM